MCDVPDSFAFTFFTDFVYSFSLLPLPLPLLSLERRVALPVKHLKWNLTHGAGQLSF